MEQIVQIYKNNLKKMSISFAVYETLSQAIIMNMLKSNSRIKEEEFAKLLNVSRTPVRESLNVLMKRGLIVSDIKSGYVVKGFSTNEANDIIRYVKVLRREAAGITAKKITDEQIIILEKNVLTEERINVLKSCGKKDEIYSTFQDFNLLVAKYTNNKYLLEESKRMHEKLLLIHYYYPENIKDDHPADLFALESQEVFKAISEHDSAKAREAVEECDVHILNVTRHVYNLRKDYV